MAKLILVEGIPGSGKTTTARKLKEELELQGKSVVLYEEGASHPADMSWNTFLTIEEFNQFLDQCSHLWEELHDENEIDREELLRRIKEQARYEMNHVILAYTKINFPQPEYWGLIGEVAKKEICDGRSSLDEFTQIHLTRWSTFAKNVVNRDETIIFECAFLQNHIFELLGTYEKSLEDIILYMKKLLDTVRMLEPEIIYLKPSSVNATIEHIARERKAPAGSGRKDWIDEISHWVEESNYGKSNGLIGKQGVIEFCEERMKIDLAVLEKLEVEVKMINREV